jgi:hypothetical protein
MRNLRTVLTGVLVIAIVGSSLAFTKINPDLYKCISGTCLQANFSSFNPNNGTNEVSVTDKYTTDDALNPVCFRAGSSTRGCKTHPAHAWLND